MSKQNISFILTSTGVFYGSEWELVAHGANGASAGLWSSCNDVSIIFCCWVPYTGTKVPFGYRRHLSCGVNRLKLPLCLLAPPMFVFGASLESSLATWFMREEPDFLGSFEARLRHQCKKLHRMECFRASKSKNLNVNHVLFWKYLFLFLFFWFSGGCFHTAKVPPPILIHQFPPKNPIRTSATTKALFWR